MVLFGDELIPAHVPNVGVSKETLPVTREERRLSDCISYVLRGHYPYGDTKGSSCSGSKLKLSSLRVRERLKRARQYVARALNVTILFELRREGCCERKSPRYHVGTSSW